MPTITDEAICIRRWDYSETSQTVSLFTATHGIIRGLAKGTQREKGKFSGGIDLLSRGQVVAIVKSGRELSTLTEWDLLETYWPLRQNLPANRAAHYMADLVHQMMTDHDPHPKLYEALAAGLARLGASSGIEAPLLAFQWALLQETGYRPQLDRDAQTGAAIANGQTTLAFSAAAGGTVADTGEADRWRVRGETIAVLRQVAAGELADVEEDESLQRANRLLAAYVRELIGREPPTMRWVFSDLPR